MSGPNDRIPTYRLKMSANLAPLGRMATWWRPRLTAALAPHLAGRLVWDLLPGEHAAAWCPEQVAVRRRVTVRFVDRNGRTVSHWNKLLKGALVRHLLTERPAGPEELAGWEHPSGYRVDEVASDLAAEPAVLVLRERDESAQARMSSRTRVKWHPLAPTTNECQISWYPNTRGRGSGRFRASTTAPTVYSSPPVTSRVISTADSDRTSCGKASTASHPSTR